MTRTGSKANHRSKKKRITFVLAPVAALAVALPLMNQAGAATPSEVAADCKADSGKLDSCDFVDVQVKRNSLGPNERVSTVSNNCDSTGPVTKAFDVTASVTRVVQLEDGFVVDGGFTLVLPSVFEIGGKFNTSEINIKRDDTTQTMSFSRTDTVKPEHIGFFMWSSKRTDVSGFLKATYKEEQDGQKVFFSPSEGGATHHVFYPQLLKNGTPDGRLWLRNVKCGTPQANGIINSAGSVRAEPGFDEGGANVTDIEIPLSEIAAQ